MMLLPLFETIFKPEIMLSAALLSVGALADGSKRFGPIA
jgi:hypothetical protein